MEDYRLSGPQVEPAGGYWTRCDQPQDHSCNTCLTPRPIPIQDVIDLTSSGDHYVESREEVEAHTEPDFQELLSLVPIRDDAGQVVSTRHGRERAPISAFLQFRPPTLGGSVTVNTARGNAFPVILNGRELARYFENNTPGAAHRQALNILIRDTGWSPPRQAWVWAALDVTIFSALAAAWHFKWLYERTRRRQRPHEYDVVANANLQLDVLYDRFPNSTGSDDGRERPLFPHVPGYINSSPGTPRHPAYPSGHSTYGAAASELLSFFFPDYRRELLFLADNTGLARLWAGIHWRRDHINGMKLGRAVACLMIEQLRKSGIPPIAPQQNMTEVPPSVAELEQEADDFAANCGQAYNDAPGFIYPIPDPCVEPSGTSGHVPGQTPVN